MLNYEKVLSDITLCSSLCTIILGDFNARCSVWWTREKTTIEGVQLESNTTVYQISNMERFAKVVMGENSITL